MAKKKSKKSAQKKVEVASLADDVDQIAVPEAQELPANEEPLEDPSHSLAPPPEATNEHSPVVEPTAVPEQSPVLDQDLLRKGETSIVVEDSKIDEIVPISVSDHVASDTRATEEVSTTLAVKTPEDGPAESTEASEIPPIELSSAELVEEARTEPTEITEVEAQLEDATEARTPRESTALPVDALPTELDLNSCVTDQQDQISQGVSDAPMGVSPSEMTSIVKATTATAPVVAEIQHSESCVCPSRISES
jgi:hypothetical protein